MKLKLAQKLLLRYYTAQLRALSLVSPRKAAEKAFDLFCTPYAGRKSSNIPPVFKKAEPLSFLSAASIIRGFRWAPPAPNGKKILIVHGFSSNAYKFERYVKPLLGKGFEVVIFDAPAHGLSDGKRINAMVYRNVILQAEELFGPFDRIMGHSLGGLAAALAFEELPGHDERKLALVAPATETTTAVANFFRMFPLPEKVQELFTGMIKKISGRDIYYYSVSRVIRNIHAPVLWVHDKNDTICPFQDVAPLLELPLPHVRFIVTENLGHSGIYKDKTVSEEIIAFLST